MKNGFAEACKDFIPKLADTRILYSRKEQNGFYTISPASFTDLGGFMFNMTAMFILSQCDGINRIKDIEELLYKYYPSVEKQLISKDIWSSLKYATELNLIDWSPISPFYVSSGKELDNGYTSHYFSGDRTDMLSFVSNTKSSESGIIYHNPLYGPSDYKYKNLMYDVYYNNLFCFDLVREDKIIGILLLKKSGYDNSNLLDLFYLYMENATILPPDWLSSAYTYLRDYMLANVTGISLHVEYERNDFDVKKIFNNCQVNFKATLLHEYGLNKHISLYVINPEEKNQEIEKVG